MTSSRRTFLGQLAAGSLLLNSGFAAAQNYPDKAVRVIVPYSSGGSTDSTARLVAQALSAKLGQQFVVDNRPGAGGALGHELAARAAPDGYTLVFSAAGPLTVTPHTLAKLGYDPINAFEPIKLVASAPLVLEVRPSLPARTVAELIALAKSKPGKLTYASFGNGSAAHLAGEMFKSAAGIDIVHVPYKGSAPALTDLLGGQVDMMFDVVVSSLPHIEAGKLRPLGITSTTRLDLLPKVPTMAEAGVKEFEAGTWFGLLAPANTDRQVIARLSAAMDDVLQQPELRKTLAGQGAVVRGGTSEDFRKFFLSEYSRWGKVVKAAGVKVD